MIFYSNFYETVFHGLPLIINLHLSVINIIIPYTQVKRTYRFLWCVQSNLIV